MWVWYPIGNVNAHDAATVMAIIKGRESTPSSSAKRTTIGTIITAVALFDKTSVSIEVNMKTNQSIT